MREAIAEAASEVDRPVVYAVAIIVAGFLPIYVLSGPSGRLFRPIADTTIFALIAALALTLTVVPVLCALFLGGARERRNPAYEAVLAAYTRVLDWCLSRPRVTVLVSLGVFGASLLLAAGMGAEFMPHLDEGALWVRATMPATISLEESAKLVPQFRQILHGFPEVTVVASEHGRPDDGTNPIGFFNAEFYVGLKPYNEWHGPYHAKAELIAAMNEKLSVFPGVSLH